MGGFCRRYVAASLSFFTSRPLRARARTADPCVLVASRTSWEDRRASSVAMTSTPNGLPGKRLTVDSETALLRLRIWERICCLSAGEGGEERIDGVSSIGKSFYEITFILYFVNRAQIRRIRKSRPAKGGFEPFVLRLGGDAAQRREARLGHLAGDLLGAEVDRERRRSETAGEPRGRDIRRGLGDPVSAGEGRYGLFEERFEDHFWGSEQEADFRKPFANISDPISPYIVLYIINMSSVEKPR